MNCPCCRSNDVLTRDTWRLTRVCSACEHRWQPHPNARSIDYRAQSGRNAVNSPGHRAKLDDRLKEITPFVFAHIRVLEIGCAEGSLATRVMALGAMSYTGIELSSDANSARQVVHRVIQEPVSRLKSEVFDLILSFHVLEHIDDIASELQDWRRLISDAGVMIVEVPNRAGHALLSEDPNIEHLHQFTPASLIALLQHSGFTIAHLSSGHRESSVYSDSLRVIARPTKSFEIKRAALMTRFRYALPRPFAVWGVGGDFQSYVAPWIASLPLRALIDSDERRHGTQIGDFRVTAFDPQLHGDLLILIASLRFSADIEKSAKTAGIAADSLVFLEDIFDEQVPQQTSVMPQ